MIHTSLSIPVNYNGSIRTREDAQVAYESTGVGGVMVARGLLHNPGLFDGRRLGDPEVLTGNFIRFKKLVNNYDFQSGQRLRLSWEYRILLITST